MPKPPKRRKTREQRLSVESMIKPGELIDFVEMSPLSLIDRRTYNLLLAHAWDRIDQPVTHVIAKSELQGLSRHESTDCIGDSIECLMAAIVRTYVEIDGKPAIQRAQLLGSTTEARAPDGLLYYTFSPEMRAIIRDSNIFARLHKDVILQLSSKYSLALYELCKKRVNLEHTWSEEFTVERFRQLLGVDPGALPAFKSLNQRAIQPAVAEINLLCDFGCAVEPVLAGRKVVKLKVSWWRKNTDELKTAYRELQASKVGRKARLKGTVERIAPALDQLAAPIDRPTEAPPEPSPLAAEPKAMPLDAEALEPADLDHLREEVLADSTSPGGRKAENLLRLAIERDSSLSHIDFKLPNGTVITIKPNLSLDRASARKDALKQILNLLRLPPT